MMMTASVPDPRPTRAVDELVAGIGRHAVIGYGAVMVIILAPLSVRLAYGVLTPSVFLSALSAFGVVMACGMAGLVLAFRTALVHRFSVRAAGAVSLLSTMPIMVLGYLAMANLQKLLPWFCFLGPEEPTTAGYQVFTALADSFPAIAVWAGSFALPALLRMHAARERELDAVRREAELLRLKAHLEPHFLLNTMNAIGGLVTEDPAHARELLGTLGELLRDATSIGDSHRVKDEVAWLERYVAIHQARFPGLFTVEWAISPDTEEAAVPALVSQPLVENAISHGALRGVDGKIIVRIAYEAGLLVLEVRDNGPGLSKRRVGGKGLSIVERRLALESGGSNAASATLELLREGTWTVARVALSKKGAS